MADDARPSADARPSDDISRPAPTLAIPTLVTERLVLRPPLLDDLEAWCALWADPDATRHIGGPRDREQAWRNLAGVVGHWALRGYGLWVVEERSGGALLGRVGLHRPERWPGIECAWALAPAAWGRGFATEASRAALAWGFDRVLEGDRPPERLLALIEPANHASIRVAEKLGMERDGSLEIHDQVVDRWAVERDRWLAAAG